MEASLSSEIIDRLGGTVRVAKLCQVTKGAVAQWRRNGIPPARELYLRAIRPDVFPAMPALQIPATECGDHRHGIADRRDPPCGGRRDSNHHEEAVLDVA